MSQVSFSIYLIRGVISLLVVVLLTFIRKGNGWENKYKYARVSISLAALSDTAMDFWACSMMLTGIDYFAYHWVWYPVYYFQWMILGLALLKLIESRSWSWVFPPACIVVSMFESIRYRQMVNDNYAGSQNIAKKELGYNAWLFYFIYVLLGALDLCVTQYQTMDNIIMALACITVVWITVNVLNMVPEGRASIIYMKNSPPQEVEEQNAPMQEVDFKLHQKVKEWEEREDKPYCQESIMLAMVADELRVSTRTLSTYLNYMRNMNFNTWINTLRVEEIKRYLKDYPEADCFDIMVHAGFQNRVSLGRVVKQVSGKTLTELRKGS